MKITSLKFINCKKSKFKNYHLFQKLIDFNHIYIYLKIYQIGSII
ncbi:hypothetical protein J694_0740 [Acinetobacter sp. 1281984]|nr:hypothetical protein J694_0740 [Acinetobacter sp. 1281984]